MRKKEGAMAAVLLTILCFTGCGNLSYDMAYHVDYDVSSFNVVSRQDTRTAAPFAANLCVTAGNVAEEDSPDMSLTGAAALFGLDEKKVIYARNVHERLQPASLTKVMTALVALENGQLNQTLTATNAVNITESGAVLCGLKSGDTMTLDQALRILLVYSSNDVAMMIAENIGGSVEHFVEMMNEKAYSLGATNTNFMNPHGLTDSEHYTTAYDLYLIFKEAIKYDTFNEIIHMSSYQTVFYDKDGKEKPFNKQTTNLFLRGNYQPPANVTVIGGKTGTTNAAGNCLILLSRDENGSPYISVILRAEGGEALYSGMQELLGEIHK
ncbi:D-alanyl-D-alanine carboxypeptidase family protein [Acetatifactor muris]|uniref:D-alanyl-D-alanine carboxypeptidase family protein n=1 Tax=Acetatifactor muris TaxID=879566 RepID=UPI0023F1919B|nr:penicillin-binding transpeptidase domain-containing protein [Acetatifactor muris]